MLEQDPNVRVYIATTVVIILGSAMNFHHSHMNENNCMTHSISLVLRADNYVQMILKHHLLKGYEVIIHSIDLGDLGVTYSPRDPRFASLNPVEVDGFFQDVKILSTSLPEETLSWGSRV